MTKFEIKFNKIQKLLSTATVARLLFCYYYYLLTQHLKVTNQVFSSYVIVGVNTSHIVLGLSRENVRHASSVEAL
jgi:hypothetical protein